MDQSVKKNKYNYCLDFMKGIACICVVFMHCEFPGTLGVVVQAVSRFCVPFFFMVSGYFCFYENKEKAKSSWTKIKHILKITVAASAFYIAIEIIKIIITGEGTLSITYKAAFVWIVFNQPSIIAGQLWFLFALLYVYVMYAIVNKYNLFKLAYGLIPVLIVLYIACAQGAHILGKSILNMYYRNFLIEGFPLFMLGHWIHKNKEKLQFRNSILITVVLICTLLCLVERYLLGRDFGVNICTFPQVTALFLYCVNNADKGKGLIQRMGNKCSMLVYILHPFVWHSIEKMYVEVGIENNTAALYLMPIIVLAITIALSIICNAVTTTVKRVRGNKNA